MNAKLPSRLSGPLYTDDGTELISNAIEQHLLRPCKLKVSKIRLNNFAGQLLRWRFLLKDLIGDDKLLYSPSKSREKFHIVDEHQLSRLCQFIWFSPYFSEIMKDQLKREVQFHLANISNDREAISEVEEDLEELSTTPDRRYYKEFFSNLSNFKELEGNYLFNEKTSLLDHIKKHFQVSKDGSFYFHSTALTLFTQEVYATICRANKKSSQQLICKGLANVFIELFSLKLKRKIKLSSSLFKKYIHAPTANEFHEEYKELLEYKELPRFSSLKVDCDHKVDR